MSGLPALASEARADADLFRTLHVLGTIVLVHATVETWFWLAEMATPVPGVIALAVVYTALLALGTVARFRRSAIGLLAVTSAVQIVWTFPFFANHTFLLLVVTCLLGLPEPKDVRECRLSHAAIGWITILVLFYTGFQKLLHGTYFRGQYLALMVSVAERFRGVFGRLVPPGELQRLQSIGPPAPGSGPYHVDGAIFPLLSNFVVVAEIGLAAGLLWPRTRRLSIYLTLVMLLFIELGAREVFFGLLFANLVLALHPGGLLVRVLPVSLALYALMLLWVLTGYGGFIT